MTNANISALILSKIAAGMTIEAAINATFGEGAYNRIAGEIYDALRAKAA